MQEISMKKLGLFIVLYEDEEEDDDDWETMMQGSN